MSTGLRRLDEEMETVFKVAKPGPLGVLEHKFSAEEIAKANNTVHTALQTWQKNASNEKNIPTMKDFIDV